MVRRDLPPFPCVIMEPGIRRNGEIMIVRRASGEEMLALWGYPEADKAPPTARFFYSSITAGNTIFWTLDDDGILAGELYAFLDLPDREFADGRTTAYLCAFRIRKDCRGQGHGSRLMAEAIAELKSLGFRHVTIGVGCDEPQNIRLYHRLGFNTKIRDCHYDPCAMDENMCPVYEENAWWLLQKDL